MKNISLTSLFLRNFKGIREFVLDTENANADVFGDNAKGKTTLFDGFTWLLFDKDSTNRKDFEIKTLAEDGSVLHGLEHEAEGVLSVDGRKVTLRKVFTEKWTKKRGSATQEFTGHTTDYYIDGVPVKAKEYKDFVDEIVGEDIFKLLTSPTFFNEQLKWQDRRKTLLQVCGDISDSEVIAGNKHLHKLPDILNGRSIEDHRKVIAAKRADINKELEKIPVRIDEAQRSMPDTNGLDEASLQDEITAVREQIDSKDAEAFRLRQGGQVVVKENQLREIEGELLQIKNRVQAGALEKVAAKRQEVSTIKGQYSDLQRKVSDITWTIDRNNQRIADYQIEAGSLRDKWHVVNDETFIHTHDANCPTCGQGLPEEQVKSAHEKALASFNKSKADRLEQITTKGKLAAAESKALQEENSTLNSQVDMLKQQLTTKETELNVAEAQLKELQGSVINIETDPDYTANQREAAAIREEISELRASSQEAVERVQEQIVALKNEMQELEQQKAKFAQVVTTQKRIEELKQQEKTLAAEYERLEQELFLTEEFIRTKVNLLEDKINSKFQYARFKLFEQQINGGLSEVCETTYLGVPYSSGLNNAARINVGLDIINTLSEHYGFAAPIFIDNAEAVTKLIDTTGQQIRLLVSEADKQLRVVKQENSMREAV